MHRIIFAILIIIIIYIIIKLFTKNANLVYVMPANKQQVVTSSALINSGGTTTNNCTYSIWFYVNDWSVNYGEEKVIFQRSASNTGPVDLSLYLGSYEQSLFVKTAILSGGNSNETKYTTSTDKYISVGWCNPDEIENNPANSPGTVSTKGDLCWYSQIPAIQNIAQSEVKCNTDKKCLGFSNNSAWNTKQYGTAFFRAYGESDPNFTDVSSSLNEFTQGQSGFYGVKKFSGYKTCTIPNIELQKWINVIISATTNSMDIYINGTLAQTCDLDGEINIQNSSNVYLSPNNKGFNGWNSKFQFWNYYINPAQASAIYRQGHGGSNTGSLDYKLNVTLYNGSTQKGTISI